MKFGIVTFPGSNCDYDAYQAVVESLGEDAVFLWHKDHDLQSSDIVILPGGFSYGDYLRLQPDHAGGRGTRAARRAGARHLQRLPDRVRGGTAAWRPASKRVAEVRLRADRAPSRVGGDDVHVAIRARAAHRAAWSRGPRSHWG